MPFERAALTKQRILHITPWYPNERQPGQAVWIQRHVRCLEPYFDQHVLHIEVEFGGFGFRKKKEESLTEISVRIPWLNWRLREWIYWIILVSFCIRNRTHRTFDIVNFHIAYPACVWEHRISRLLPKKKIITEHWSYYHFHFHSRYKLTRIKNIFKRGIPVITVSEALARDIELFAGNKIDFRVVPNAVDQQLFHLDESVIQTDQFFMAAYWKAPKNPFAVLHGINVLKEKGIIIKVRIAGYGPLWEQLKSQVSLLQLEDQIELIGKIDSAQMCKELNRATAFILPSEYETFSVVCAEALSCGCPVLSEPFGALPELVTPGNGLLREEEETWSSLLERFVHHAPFDRKSIADRSREKYSSEKVGLLYSDVLKAL